MTYKISLKLSPLGDALNGLYGLLSLKPFHLMQMSLHLFQEMTDTKRLSLLSLKDKESRREEPFQEDAPITGGIIDIWEELGADKSTEKGSNDTKEMVNMLRSMEAANILSSGGAVISVSPADVFPTAGVPTVSGSFPTVSAI
nr:hypothetical protein [Tanacetum cinerariifolium]